MRLSRLVGAAALALLLFVSLVVTAPARLLRLVVPEDQVQLRGLSGTLWQGSAGGVLVRLPQGYFQLGAVQWSLKPWSLLLLAPRLTMHSEWGKQTLAGELVLHDPQNLELYNLEAQVEAALLTHFAPVEVDGMLSVQLQHLELRDGLPHSGDGRLVWQNAGWKSPRGLVPFGAYALDFQQVAGEALEGEVITLTGPLQANGSVRLRERHYELDILLGSETNLDEQVQQMLSLIAVPENGSFRITMAGDL